MAKRSDVSKGKNIEVVCQQQGDGMERSCAGGGEGGLVKRWYLVAEPVAWPRTGTTLRCCIGMPVVNAAARMAGGQCPPKGGAIDHHRCHGELINQLNSELTN